MADLSEDVIPVSATEYNKLYPLYEREALPGQTFQEWLRQRQDIEQTESK